MHAILNASRIDVRDEAAEIRRRKIGEGIADIGTRVAIHRGLQNAAIDEDIDATDAIRVGRPTLYRERSAGVVLRSLIGDVEITERSLIDRVVDVDRSPPKLEDTSVGEIDLHVHSVRSVREPAGEETRLESRSDVVNAGIVRIRLD